MILKGVVTFSYFKLTRFTQYICETCNEYLSLIRRSDDGRFESILCPKCEEHTLEFQDTGGIWD